MMPHSLQDVDVLTSTPPVHSPKDLDIKINQDQCQPFGPGSVVSGYVVFFGREADFRLDIEFFGRTRTAFNISQESTYSKLHYADEAILFSYKRPLNEKYRPGNDDWTKDSHWKFEFRFPSNTENRRTVSYGYRRTSVGRWCDSIHPLPPSLKRVTSHCSFSIEYMLCARVYVDKRLMSCKEVPLHFTPSRLLVGVSPLSPLTSPKSSSSITLSVGEPFLESSSTLPLRNRTKSAIASSIMTVYAPQDLTSGQFLSIRGEISFIDLSDYIKQLEPFFTVKTEEIQLTYHTGCRGRLIESDKSSSIDVEDVTCIIGEINLNVNDKDTIERISDHTFTFALEAKIPDRLLPSFGSFLVYNSYSIHARVVAQAWGHEHRTCFVMDDVPILLPSRSPLSNRRTSPPPLVGPVPVGRR